MHEAITDVDYLVLVLLDNLPESIGSAFAQGDQ
jgi:hypothetical protein